MERPDPERRVDDGERTPEPSRPRIYLASLADYNDGRLYGRWINADQIVDDIRRQAAEMLDASPMLSAEEYAIHDYDGFGPIHLGEHEDLETVALLGEGIAQHGEAFAHWASLVGHRDQDELARFDDAYLGTWDNERAYAESLVDELGIEEALDRAEIPLRNYVSVDIEMLTRDLRADHYISEGAEGVHVFSTS